MTDSIPVTQETYDQLVAELEKLKKEDRPHVIQEIADARAQGDLRENAEYHAAKDRQGEIESRIAFLEDRIARAAIMRHDTTAADRVLFGATVTVRNLATGKDQEFTIVNSEAVDAALGRISNVSPIGKALIGKAKGDTVEVQTPRGALKFKIVDYR